MKTTMLVIAALAASSCATVIRGAKETAEFESSPSGATVTVSSISADQLGPFSCVTPCELQLKRKRTWEIEYTLDGYQTARGILRPVVTGGGVASGAGNVFAGGPIGIGVDAGTGANKDLRPNPMIAEMAVAGEEQPSRIIFSKAEDEFKSTAAEAKARAKLAEKAGK